MKDGDNLKTELTCDIEKALSTYVVLENYDPDTSAGNDTKRTKCCEYQLSADKPIEVTINGERYVKAE